jgi:hypothetical protein
MDQLQITREEFHAHETARLRKRGDPDPERHVERLWEWVEELTTRFDARCCRAPDDDCPPTPCSR